MSYSKYCPICSGFVDSNEFNYAKDMCDDCVLEEEMQEQRRLAVSRIMKSECKQIMLEV